MRGSASQSERYRLSLWRLAGGSEDSDAQAELASVDSPFGLVLNLCGQRSKRPAEVRGRY